MRKTDCRLTWLNSLLMRDEYRNGHRGQYAARRTAKYEFAKPRMPVAAHHDHARRTIRDPRQNDIGHVDITAHVDWTSVVERGGEYGLSLNGFTDQHHFITGLISRLPQEEFAGEREPHTRRALQTLLHPEFLGTAFQFLALAKNAPDQHLSGFKFAREPRSALGL